MARKVAPKKQVKDEPFAKRLQLACDNHPHCPALHHGRLTWIVREFKTRFKVTITTETARKWCAGEVRPRRASMTMLSELMLVDEAWLSLGNEGEVTADERKARNVMAGAAVNLLAGMIELDGGHPAYPEKDDPKAKDVDIFAIIRGVQYQFKIVLGHNDGGKRYTFSIPSTYRDVFVLGLVRTGPFHFDVLEIDAEAIGKNKQNKGSHVAVTANKRGTSYTVGGSKLRQITSFAERL